MLRSHHDNHNVVCVVLEPCHLSADVSVFEDDDCSDTCVIWLLDPHDFGGDLKDLGVIQCYNFVTVVVTVDAVHALSFENIGRYGHVGDEV